MGMQEIETREAHALRTSHGLIWIEQSGRGQLPVLLIHGNSSCLQVFRYQLDSPLARRNRLIAFDLPGHGRSSNAVDPARTYTLPGFADVSREILSLLAFEEAVVFGWSLGGHVALEMMQEFSGAKGLVLVGTPPVGPDTFSEGFRPSPHFKLAAEAKWSDADVERFRPRSSGWRSQKHSVRGSAIRRGRQPTEAGRISEDTDRGAEWR